MKEDFASNKALDEIVEKINTAEDELSLAIDPSVSTNWESLLIAKVSDVPFHYIGKGDQCMTKTHLVLDSRNKEACVLLLEEPENHLSYGRLHKFISQIERKNATSQIIMTTHSSMVCNKLDLGNLILLGRNETPAYFKRLDEDTRKFFQKVSGFDTLRVVLSPRSILVEGPSDDLILQKAYYLAYEHMPIEDGVDIISVSGLSFKRYASIVQCINNKVAIVTDNDGIAEKKEIRYEKYRNNNMKLFFSPNNSLKTLEPQIVEANKSNLSVLTHILGISEDDKITEDYLVDYMQKHKTDSALAIFETDEKVNMPEYIEEAIRWIKTDS
jgi:ATP-dependent endonuclease (old family)